MKKYKNFLLSFTLLIGFCLNADSSGEIVPEDNIDKVGTAENIARAVLSETDGYLTKPLHEFYWKNMKDATPDERGKMKMLLQDIPHLQLMIWRSVEKSIENKKETYVAGLFEELVKLDGMPDIIVRTKELISSAANKKPFRYEDEEILFTLPLAKQFVKNWAIVEERGIALSDKMFNFKKTNHTLTSNMSLDSVFFPNNNNINIVYDNKHFTTKGFHARFGENKFMLISETKDKVKFSKKGTESCVDGFFKTIKVFDKIDIITKGKSSFALKTFPSDELNGNLTTAVSCEYRDGKIYSMLVTTADRNETIMSFKELVNDLHIANDE